MLIQSNEYDKNNETTTQLVITLQEQLLANQRQLQVNETLAQEIKLLREQIAYLTNKLYGKSKESLPEQLSGQLSLDLFDEPVERYLLFKKKQLYQPSNEKVEKSIRF